MSADKYILVDYENVQPTDLDQLRDQGFIIRIFLGMGQDRLPLNTVTSLQVFGTTLKYVQTCGVGPNALDFHIAYFLGVQSTKTPAAKFFVISRDMGFDPLLRYLWSEAIYCRRVTSVREIIADLALDIDGSCPPMSDLSRTVLVHLAKGRTGRPRTIRTLRTAISVMFDRKLRIAQIDEIIFSLRAHRYIVEEGPRIVYSAAISDLYPTSSSTLLLSQVLRQSESANESYAASSTA